VKVVAPGFRKQLFESQLVLVIVALVFAQAGFDDLSGNHIEAEHLRYNVNPTKPGQNYGCDSQESPSGSWLRHVDRIRS
jgi:hypothetical protein